MSITFYVAPLGSRSMICQQHLLDIKSSNADDLLQFAENQDRALTHPVRPGQSGRIRMNENSSVDVASLPYMANSKSRTRSDLQIEPRAEPQSRSEQPPSVDKPERKREYLLELGDAYLGISTRLVPVKLAAPKVQKAWSSLALSSIDPSLGAYESSELENCDPMYISWESHKSMMKKFATSKMDFVDPIILTINVHDAGYLPTYAAYRTFMDKIRTMHRSAWGSDLRGIFKAECSSDDSPHVHEYMDCPSGLSNHSLASNRSRYLEPFNGLKYEDWIEAVVQYLLQIEPNAKKPRLTDVSRNKASSKERASRYFAKLGEGTRRKAYQNRLVPSWVKHLKKGQRIQAWGSHGLTEKETTVTAIGQEEFHRIKRIARRITATEIDSINEDTGEVKVIRRELFRSKGKRGGFAVRRMSKRTQEQLLRLVERTQSETNEE